MTILVQDSFNRVDNVTTLGNADTGQTWLYAGTTKAGIIGNQAYISTINSYNPAYHDIATQQFAAQITFVNLVNLQGFFVRHVDLNNFVSIGYTTVGGNKYQLRKRVTSTFTTLWEDATVIPQAGDVLRIEHDGSTIRVYINGVLKATVTDSTHLNTTQRVGFSCPDASPSTARFDNYLVETLSSGGTALTLSLSDSITLGESFVKQRQGYLSLVDGIILTESFTKRRQAYLSLTDGLTIGDTETSTRATINTLVRALSDSINITDSITIRAMRYLTIFDLFSIVDSIGTTGGGNVAQTIKFKRGNEVDLPTLAEGEPAITIDTNKMFVGTPNGNIQIATLLVVDSVANLPVADKSKQFLISGVLGTTGTADALYVCKKLSNDTYDWVQFV